MDSAARYIEKTNDAQPQIIILVDMAKMNANNFLCINDSCCTDEEHLALFEKNNSRFYMIAKNDKITGIEGVQALMNICEVTCLRSPYLTHSSSKDHPDGIIWKAVENGIIEWATGKQDTFNEKYEVFYPAD